MNRRKISNHKGITLIALVISIIVMLILAGVSLNATIGDNGIITKAQDATYAQSRAMLEEYINQFYMEHYDEFNENENKAVALKNYRDSSSWFYQGAPLGYVVDSDGNAHYFINVEGLPEDIKYSIKGGNANGKNALTYQDYANMEDIYGITSDLRVYYCSSGKDSITGVVIEDLDIADSTKEVFDAGSNMAELITGTPDTAVTLEDLKKVKKLTIDSTSGITNLLDLYTLVSLQELTLEGLNLNNLDGIENAIQLNYVYFKSCIIDDYSSLGKLANRLKYLYLYNIDDKELERLCSESIGIGNCDFSNLNYLAIVGETSYISDIDYGHASNSTKSSRTITSLKPMANLTDITKKSVKYLTLQNENITDKSDELGSEYNLKDIDRYIWQLGKEYFPKNYKKKTIDN